MISLFALVRSTMQFFKYHELKCLNITLMSRSPCEANFSGRKFFSIYPFDNFRMEVQGFPSGAQCLSGRVLDSRPKGSEFEPHHRHCVVSLSKNINPNLVLFNPGRPVPLLLKEC